MSNKEIAQAINSIGDMLEVLGENSFRVSAYHRAARLIDMQILELKDLYEREGIAGLEKIPGVGESIAQKIEELIKTGKSDYQQRLRKKVPSAIIEFAKIPGVGPKTAYKLYQLFKVNSIEQLKLALKNNQHLEKIKEKTRANIIRGIDILLHQSGRLLLSFAEPIAREVVAILKKYPQIKQANFAGSLRRMKETVGDIDIIAATRQKIKNQILNFETNKEIINKFIKEPFVSKVINQGATKATIIDNNGVQIDLEILPADEYGSLLQHFTGSKDHNIALRTYAEKIGFSVSEHGIKKGLRGKGQGLSKIIKCNTEEKVYKMLGMQTPSPELRENQGEIEAAVGNNLPALVKLSDIKGDLQMHSNYSDGSGTIQEMAEICQKLGYEYLAITDHSATLGITGGLKLTNFEKYINEIKKISKKLGIKIFTGIEANIKPDGNIDLPEVLMKKMDIVLASIHTSFRQDRQTTTQRLIRAIQNPYVKIIAHPTGRIINRRPEVDADWTEVFKICKKYNKVMEINSYPDRLDLNDRLIRQAIDMGVKLSINTDSHQPAHLLNIRYGVAQARRGWCEAKDIVNTYNLAKFKEYFGLK